MFPPAGSRPLATFGYLPFERNGVVRREERNATEISTEYPDRVFDKSCDPIDEFQIPQQLGMQPRLILGRKCRLLMEQAQCFLCVRGSQELQRYVERHEFPVPSRDLDLLSRSDRR